MDYEREDDYPGRQTADLIGRTDVPRIGNLVESRAKQPAPLERRIGCIMRGRFYFQIAYCLFLHPSRSGTHAIPSRCTRPIDDKPAPCDNTAIKFQNRYLAMQRHEMTLIKISRSEKSLFFSTYDRLSMMLVDNR